MQTALSTRTVLSALSLFAVLSACGGGTSENTTRANSVAIEGNTIDVTWDRATAQEATATGVITSDEPVLVAAKAIEKVTGCVANADAATLGESIFVRADGQLQLTLGIDCTQVTTVSQNTPVQTISAQASDQDRMAAAVEAAVRQVVAEPSSRVLAQTTSAGGTRGGAQLYEGSPYAAFSAAEIQTFCGQDWTTRVAANGRTEYNPCTQRSAFR